VNSGRSARHTGYRAALAFLDSLVNYEKLAKPREEFKLDNIRRLLELAGNPQTRLKNVILVAGTKGKGSVCYMLDAALRGCGLRTGLFVSPHVLDVRERIQLNGKPISQSAFARQVERLRRFVQVPALNRQSSIVNRESPVSYFELTAAMAFDLFARRKLDYAIVEVGLGGRLDATNLSEPQVSVITRIGLDHVKVLGGTLRKIAREKAGIMRRGKSVILGIQEPQALAELASCARTVRANLIRAESSVRVYDETPTQTGVAFQASGELGSGRFVLPLLGRHQVENCRTVLTVLGLLAKSDPRIKMGGIRKGLRHVSIPARCQVVRGRPLTIADSCHNPDSGRALARVIADYVKRRVILVYGSLGGKLVSKTVRPLAPWVETAVLVKPDSPRAMALPELKRIFTGLGISHVTADSVPEALSLARQSSIVTHHSPLPIVVAGSFYLAGEALRVLRRGT